MSCAWFPREARPVNLATDLTGYSPDGGGRLEYILSELTITFTANLNNKNNNDNQTSQTSWAELQPPWRTPLEMTFIPLAAGQCLTAFRISVRIIWRGSHQA